MMKLFDRCNTTIVTANKYRSKTTFAYIKTVLGMIIFNLPSVVVNGDVCGDDDDDVDVGDNVDGVVALVIIDEFRLSSTNDR